MCSNKCYFTKITSSEITDTATIVVPEYLADFQRQLKHQLACIKEVPPDFVPAFTQRASCQAANINRHLCGEHDGFYYIE